MRPSFCIETRANCRGYLPFLYTLCSQRTPLCRIERLHARDPKATNFAMTSNAPLHDQCVLICSLAQEDFFSQFDAISTQARHCHTDKHVLTRHSI